MDVYPPHGSIDTWRDFWIHLGTIAIGLVIALALEAGAEKVHHLHQRHELEADLRAEGVRNADIAANDLRADDVTAAWLLALRQDADTMRASAGKVRLPFRHPPPRPFYTPLSGVWQTAKESSMTALLPTKEAQLYTVLYYELDFERAAGLQLVTDMGELDDMEANFAPAATPLEPDLSRMNSQQLDAYAAVLNKIYIDLSTARFRMAAFAAVNRAILNGATSETQFLDVIQDAGKKHP